MPEQAPEYTNIVIAGSRSFNDYIFLADTADIIIRDHAKGVPIIVSGCAKGADRLGEEYAFERGYDLIKMPAKWDKYGKSAGHIRNEEMAKIADLVICFWDGESPGTRSMLNICRRLKKKVFVF